MVWCRGVGLRTTHALGCLGSVYALPAAWRVPGDKWCPRNMPSSAPGRSSSCRFVQEVISTPAPDAARPAWLATSSRRRCECRGKTRVAGDVVSEEVRVPLPLDARLSHVPVIVGFGKYRTQTEYTEQSTPESTPESTEYISHDQGALLTFPNVDWMLTGCCGISNSSFNFWHANSPFRYSA